MTTENDPETPCGGGAHCCCCSPGEACCGCGEIMPPRPVMSAEDRNAVFDCVAERTREAALDGDGFWRTCSGCYETEDGYPNGRYPHSPEFGCALGGGCGDCGGIGAIRDTTNYEQMSADIIAADKPRVYLAARFSRRHECHALGQQLQALGVTITSRWTRPDTDRVAPVGMSEQAADAERERFAREDLEDVRAANWTISLTEQPRGNGRGGRHNEFGIAVALGHRLTIVGPRETVFHHLPNVEHFESVEAFLASAKAHP